MKVKPYKSKNDIYISKEQAEEVNALTAINLMGFQYNSVDEMCASLSEKFSEKREYIDDAQEAFNSLNDEFSGYLGYLGFVYSIFGGDSWHVNMLDCSEPILKDVCKFFDDKKILTSDDAIAAVENRVMKTMSNVGCDVYNALSLEMEEGLPNVFEIVSDGKGDIITLY